MLAHVFPGQGANPTLVISWRPLRDTLALLSGPPPDDGYAPRAPMRPARRDDREYLTGYQGECP